MKRFFFSVFGIAVLFGVCSLNISYGIRNNVSLNEIITNKNYYSDSTAIINVASLATTNSNANLKKLLPAYEGLSPNFSPSITKYSLIVPATVTNLSLVVAVESTGAKYWISGDENLQLGDNTVTITVTATDGTKKIYTIIVTKAADIAKANAYLSNIVIDGRSLSPDFSSENLEYDIGTVASTVEKLTVLAFAKNENAKSEIIGNDKLVEGENIIKIKVTAEDGITAKEYTIKLNKESASITTSTTNNKGVDSLNSPTTDNNQDVNIYSQENNNLSNNSASKPESFLHSFWFVIILLIICLIESGQILYLNRKIKKSSNTKKSSDNISFKRRG